MSNPYTTFRDAVKAYLDAGTALQAALGSGTQEWFQGKIAPETPTSFNCPYLGVSPKQLPTEDWTQGTDREKYTLQFVVAIDNQDFDSLEEILYLLRARLRAGIAASPMFAFSFTGWTAYDAALTDLTMTPGVMEMDDGKGLPLFMGIMEMTVWLATG